MILNLTQQKRREEENDLVILHHPFQISIFKTQFDIDTHQDKSYYVQWHFHTYLPSHE